MTFGQPEALALFSAVTSHAQSLGVFDRVNGHEPVVTPGRGISCTVTLGPFDANPAASGMAAVSATLTLTVRLWSSLEQRPLDPVDPNMIGALSVFMGSLASGFTLGGTVRDVDVLAIRATPAYVNDEGKEIRVIDVSVPVVINDLWTEVA